MESNQGVAHEHRNRGLWMRHARLIGLGAVAVVVGACAPSQQGAHSTPSPVTPMIVAVKTSNPIADPWSGNPDTLQVIGLDGRVVAQEDFAARRTPYIGNAGVPLQPVVQSAGGYVYYIDGYGAVRKLKPDSTPQVIANFAQEPGQFETWFAVSPDGSQVMAGVLTFPAIGPIPPGAPWPSLVGNWKFDLELSTRVEPPVVLKHVESPRGPDAENSTWKPVFPIGWTSQGPIAMVPESIGTQNAWWGGKLYVLDSTGGEVAQLGGSDCTSASINAQGMIPCISLSPSTFSTVTVRDAKGRVAWAPATVQGFNALDVCLSPNGQGITDGQILETTNGTFKMPAGFSVQGWLDNNIVVGRVADLTTNSQGNLAWIRLDSPAQVHDLGLRADFVTAIR
jgi:hypothetical protein